LQHLTGHRLGEGGNFETQRQKTSTLQAVTTWQKIRQDLIDVSESEESEFSSEQSEQNLKPKVTRSETKYFPRMLYLTCVS